MIFEDFLALILIFRQLQSGWIDHVEEGAYHHFHYLLAPDDAKMIDAEPNTGYFCGLQPE